MPRQYTGEAKCHGCGKSGNESPRYEKESLCFNCSRVLTKGREYERMIEKDECKYSFVRLFDSAVLCNKACYETLSSLLKSLDVGFQRGYANKAENDYYLGSARSSYTDAYLKEDVAKNFEALVRDIERELQKQLKVGQEEGTSLLVGLNSGEISLSRFEETLERWKK